MPAVGHEKTFAIDVRNGIPTRPGTRPDDGHVVVTLRDTGMGIPAELLGKVFGPFFTTKEPGEGPGEVVRVRFPSLPIILVSGYNDVVDGGGDGFLVLRKPVPFQELSRGICMSLDRGAAAEPAASPV